MALLLAGCVLGSRDAIDGGVASTTEVTLVRSDPSLFQIVEVGFGEGQYVGFGNFTELPATLGGAWLCQERDCVQLPDREVGPGETLYVTVGNGSGLNGVVAAGADLPVLTPADGELALFQTNDFDDPAAMIGYLQWGKTPHAQTELAIEAGFWVEDAWAPSGANAVRIFIDLESGLWLWESA
jgi:hypothetical protein